MRSIAFGAFVCALVRLVCRSCVLCDSRGIVACASCVCRVALPLVMLSRLKFSLLLAFVGVGGAIGGLCGFRALCGKI